MNRKSELRQTEPGELVAGVNAVAGAHKLGQIFHHVEVKRGTRHLYDFTAQTNRPTFFDMPSQALRTKSDGNNVPGLAHDHIGAGKIMRGRQGNAPSRLVAVKQSVVNSEQLLDVAGHHARNIR
jgi:hypothetical protein